MLELFALPFMQKAFVVGAVLGVVLPFFGVFVLLRRMAFFADGIAHASLAGVAIGVLAGFNPFWSALAIGVFFGAGVYVLTRKMTLTSDAAIGILFTVGMAIGLLLMSFTRGYQPELISFLFGNILTIRSDDVVIIGVLGILLFATIFFLRRQLTLSAIDRDESRLRGVHTEWIELLFFILLSVSIVLGVKLLGIILVSALLILPPTGAKAVSWSLASLVVWSIIVGECMVFAGLVLSYILDIPSGATIILTGAVLVGILWLVKLVRGL